MALARRATEAIRRSADGLTSTDVIDLAARALRAAQPSMAPMAHIAGRLIAGTAAPWTMDAGLPERITRVCDELLRQIDASHHNILRHALSLFNSRPVVLTHSFSETVAAVLEGAFAPAGCLAPSARNPGR